MQCSRVQLRLISASSLQRYYSSQIARFTSPDPYRASGGPADPQSWNRYAYVRNDPVNFNDPTGLQRQFCSVSRLMSFGAEGWSFVGSYLVCEESGGGSGGAPTDTTGGGGVVPPDPTKLPHGDITGWSTAANALANEECAKLTSGTDPKRAQGWFGNTRVLARDLGVVTESGVTVARSNGSSILVNANVFLDPTRAATSRGDENYLRPFESAFKLVAGTLTTELFQAIYLLHETAHIRNQFTNEEKGATSPQEVSARSMANTLTIMQTCFKDLLKWQ